MGQSKDLTVPWFLSLELHTDIVLSPRYNGRVLFYREDRGSLIVLSRDLAMQL